MYDLSLHILDIVENSISALATKIAVLITEDRQKDRLIIEIKDNGLGMDEEHIKMAQDPFFTTNPEKKVGLGLALFAQAAQESGGSLRITSEADGGTWVEAIFGLRHIDRKPLGDMNETMRVLRATHPEIVFEYRYEIKN
jgi:signal transduction histidine kinase